MASKNSEDITSYTHSSKRANNPEAGSVRPETDADMNYEFAEYSREPHDPNLDPHLGLSYTGKTYQPMQIETRSLHIHEHINTISCLENVRKYRATDGQPSMFGTASLPAEKAIEFYKHDVTGILSYKRTFSGISDEFFHSSSDNLRVVPSGVSAKQCQLKYSITSCLSNSS